jgi:heavy metal sensor kinase
MRRLSLVNRVSLFFLASLALVLACYSGVAYFVLRNQWSRQFDEQLHGGFQTLVAAVEVEPDDVKFEPSDHTIALGGESGAEDLRWAVFDEQGLLVDRSRNLVPGRAADDELLRYAAALNTEDDASIEVGRWRVLQKRLAAVAPKPASERDPLEREALVVTVARSPDDLNANLRLLGLLVTVLPMGVGVAAAVVGRRIVRRALVPVSAMAEQARSMAAGDAGGRLPVADTGDELAELGRSFNGLLERLFGALERQRRFAGDAAHQLRTPLAALQGQVEVALRRERAADDYRQTLEVVREQTSELTEIVESLLFLARSQNEAAPLEHQALNLAEWLPAYVDHWSGHARYADIRRHAAADAVVSAPPVLLRQLVDNLIGNALKYGPAGTPVDVEAVVRGGEVEISVTDRGIGIAESDLPSVFQPFFRSADARRTGAAGTGLGLAVASQIAAALGGKLTCSSKLGEGSRFTLSLPQASVSDRVAATTKG